jgi:Ion channel
MANRIDPALIQFTLGIIAGYVEEWSLGESIYFTFITGLTIGYGDLVPKHFVSRLGAVVIGMVGIVLMGLIAAIAVRALDFPGTDKQS